MKIAARGKSHCRASAGSGGAHERVVANASTSSSDSDAAQDKVPALLSSGLSSFPDHCRRFRYRELEEATSGFDDELAIGEGEQRQTLASTTMCPAEDSLGL